MTLVVGVITWWSERLIWDFNTITLSLAPQQNWSGPTAHHCEYYFFFFFSLFCWWLCNHKSSLFAWSVSWWYFIKSLYDNSHIYTHMHTHRLTYTYLHTYTYEVLPTVYYSCHLVVFNYHKSYQQYFHILLNYKKLEIYCYKEKAINK